MTADDRTFRIRLAVITAVAAVWRFGYLLAVKIDDDLLLNDSLYYSIQAGRNSEGDWWRESLSDLPGAEHGPLTSLYLTPWSLLPGDLVAWQRVGMTVLGVVTVAAIGVAGRRLGGSPRRAWSRRPSPRCTRTCGSTTRLSCPSRWPCSSSPWR